MSLVEENQYKLAASELLRRLNAVATTDDPAVAGEERHVVAEDIKAASYFMAICMGILLFGYLLFILRKFV